MGYIQKVPYNSPPHLRCDDLPADEGTTVLRNGQFAKDLPGPGSLWKCPTCGELWTLQWPWSSETDTIVGYWERGNKFRNQYMRTPESGGY